VTGAWSVASAGAADVALDVAVVGRRRAILARGSYRSWTESSRMATQVVLASATPVTTSRTYRASPPGRRSSTIVPRALLAVRSTTVVHVTRSVDVCTR
jgi:hypothetical protein